MRKETTLCAVNELCKGTLLFLTTLAPEITTRQERERGVIVFLRRIDERRQLH